MVKYLTFIHIWALFNPKHFGNTPKSTLSSLKRAALLRFKTACKAIRTFLEDNLLSGVTIDNIHYGEVLARLDNQMPSNAWLTVAIKEGKNREIRHIMEYLGYPVSRLIRLSYGPFSLGNLENGDVREVKTNVLTEQLGLARTQSNSRQPQKPKPKNMHVRERQKHKPRRK